MELATKTITAESKIGIQSDISDTIDNLLRCRIGPLNGKSVESARMLVVWRLLCKADVAHCSVDLTTGGSILKRLLADARDLHSTTDRNVRLKLSLELHKHQASKKRETHASKNTDKKVLREVPSLILFYLWVTGERLCCNQQAYALWITRD